jgi:hypothetical protein
MEMKKILFIVFVLFSVESRANFGVEKIPLDKQLERAEAIGLVKLVEAKITYPDGKNKQVELLIEVIDGIYNLKKGARHKLLGNGFLGNDIGFNCIGSEAIIIMRIIKAPYEPEGFYATVGFEESVLHKKKNMIIGIDAGPVQYEKAIRLIKHAKRLAY